jgi:hypothetical protein
MSEYAIFTSESVSEGHPDKMADQISDAILDHILKDDREARVAVETMVKTGMVIIAGEVTTSTYVDLEESCATWSRTSATPAPTWVSTVPPAPCSTPSASSPTTSPWAWTRARTRSRAPATRA